MMISVFLVPTQAGIAALRSGRMPSEFFPREFAAQNELEAYKDGVATVERDFDECDEIYSTSVNACEVVYSYCHPHNDEAPDDVSKTLSTPGEAQAFLKGLQDADGAFGAIVVEPSDKHYDALAAACKSAYPDWLKRLVSSAAL
jgi:hypothetical protein